MAGLESYPLEAFGAWIDVIDNPYFIGDFLWTAWQGRCMVAFPH
jgi:beta-galactosidase